MERFRQSFWVGRLWTYLDAEVRMLLIGMLIMILISAGILIANLIDLRPVENLKVKNPEGAGSHTHD
jgi:hypothetical protein